MCVMLCMHNYYIPFEHVTKTNQVAKKLVSVCSLHFLTLVFVQYATVLACS